MIEKCKTLVLLVSSANSFAGYDKAPKKEYESVVRGYLEEAGKKTYEETSGTFNDEDYKNLF